MAKKASRGPGRPPKEEGERRDKPRSVVFSQDERELLDRAVTIAGGTVSEFIREAAIEKARKVTAE